MLAYDTETLNEMRSLRDTLLRVKNEGLADRFDMSLYTGETSCGTTHCAWGWHLHFSKTDATFKSHNLMVALIGDDLEMYFWDVLFGSERGEGPEALQRQINAVNWFIHRMEALREYDRIRAMPRKERRRLGVAA